ncbi:DUF2252 domain-containing protein [Novosphingopyxis iocasae]|uniref:DUF2252 domain-containing protein n=1 Tax=Novosphingopyxis iocasae TaxID=2762729 RepID=UPI0016515DC3|nr:DUF2252 family protein [Novosphingopyxis iocasae]
MSSKDRWTKSNERREAERGNRREAYERLAERFAAEAAVPLPTFLTGQARREHVRATILEDHVERIDQRAEGTRAKFDALAKSLFAFFRGTALVFYRDMAGTDGAMPEVLLLGDVHPENFGIMPNIDHAPIFSVNDFDEAGYGPFSWDIKRGATGFVIAAREIGGFGDKKRRKIAKAFVKGYAAGMEECARDEIETTHVYRMDNSPPLIARLFENALTDRKSWLKDRYQNEKGEGFRTSDELTPISSRRDEFQKLIDDLAEARGLEPDGLHGSLHVKDVAMRHGQGTASLGLDRYYVLLEGPSEDTTDDWIVEFKRARRSAMDGLVPSPRRDFDDEAARIVHGQRVHLPDGDPFYGSVTIDGISFLTRERAPFRDDIDLDDLDYGEWKDYADICGRALARAHARSDEVGDIDYDVEPAILEAMEPRHVFIDDVTCFACEAAERLRHDHKAYKRDHKRGAFERLPYALG